MGRGERGGWGGEGEEGRGGERGEGRGEEWSLCVLPLVDMTAPPPLAPPPLLFPLPPCPSPSAQSSFPIPVREVHLMVATGLFGFKKTVVSESVAAQLHVSGSAGALVVYVVSCVLCCLVM